VTHLRIRFADDRVRSALRRHLDLEIGTRRSVLAEARGLARTEQFMPVRLSAPVKPGVILDVTMTGHDGRQLQAA